MTIEVEISDHDILVEFENRKLIRELNDWEIENEYNRRDISDPDENDIRYADDYMVREEFEKRFGLPLFDEHDIEFYIRNNMLEDLLIYFERDFSSFNGITNYKLVKK